MEGSRDNKNGKQLLIIISIGLLALFNNIIGQKNVIRNVTAAFQPPSFQPATGAFAALNLSSYSSLNFNDTCDPQSTGPLSRVHYVTSGIDYTSGLNMTESTTEAICYYDKEQYYHFPHAMQQLFGCFSFWNTHPTKQPVLAVHGKTLERVLNEQRVTRNFLEMLQSQMSLQFKIINMKWVKNIPNATVKPYWVRNNGYDAPFSKELHKHAAAYFHLNDTSSFTCDFDKPRIGILNRANDSFRSLLNADQIAIYAKGLSRDDHIPVAYFEDKEYADQVAFFRSVDILIAPHGAQLVGVAYMDAPCSHLMELFPKVSHYRLRLL